MNETLTNCCMMNICAFKKQCHAYFFAETGCRLNSYLLSQVVIIRSCFSWLFTLFLVMIRSKISKFSNCLINSRFAAGYFFANFSLRKPFLVQNYNLGPFSFRQTGFFVYFLTLKNYKNIEETAQIFFDHIALSIVLLNTSS